MEKKVLNILIADDDPDDMEYMKFLFDHHINFNISACLNTGKEIVEHIEKGNVPDVLLTDYYMPYMTGAEVVQHLLRNNLAPDTQIFIISTKINERQKEEFLSHPHVKFLEKPTSLVEINDLPGVVLENLNMENINKI